MYTNIRFCVDTFIFSLVPVGKSIHFCFNIHNAAEMKQSNDSYGMYVNMVTTVSHSIIQKCGFFPQKCD